MEHPNKFERSWDIQTDSISALKTMPARQDHEKVKEER